VLLLLLLLLLLSSSSFLLMIWSVFSLRFGFNRSNLPEFASYDILSYTNGIVYSLCVNSELVRKKMGLIFICDDVVT
jgi:hypothetical protein